MKRLGKSRRGTVILTQMIQTRVTKEDAAAIDLLAAEPGTRARVMFGTDG